MGPLSNRLAREYTDDGVKTFMPFLDRLPAWGCSESHVDNTCFLSLQATGDSFSWAAAPLEGGARLQ